MKAWKVRYSQDRVRERRTEEDNVNILDEFEKMHGRTGFWRNNKTTELYKRQKRTGRFGGP